MRADLLERYEALSLPATSEEHWRFTDLRDLDLPAPGDCPRTGTVPIGSEPQTVPAGSAPAGQAVLVDAAATVTYDGISLEISGVPEGIRLEALDDAHPLLGTLVLPDDKLRAHNAACWEHGLLVHVPPDVVVEKPIYVKLTGAARLFWRLLVVADPGSRFTVIEDLSSAPRLEGYVNTVSEIVVHDGARAELVSLQSLAHDTWYFASNHATVGRDAELDWVVGGFGSRKGKVWIQNDLIGRGATSRVTGAYFADGTQHLDYDTYQRHAAPDTTSDFAFKGALRDRAHAVWRGMIRVEEGAQRTNAYQENRNLLLAKTAVANSIPGLEILANDVRCTHGATLGQVDREQLFYLMSRGLSRAEAERLIVRGFFQDVLDRIELEPVRDAVTASLDARLPD
ncbi:MAG: Fe-S cluster assembly protein SufD [Gaiella sp.]